MGSAGTQGVIWGARARDWAEANEPAWQGVFATALQHAGVRHETRHLDIGCGAGGALAASRELGASVAGLDASEALVAIARRRLPGARVEVGEMEELPFGDGSFDVVTAINSVQFAADPVRTLGEAQRVTAPDGSVLVLVWGRREDCELISVTASAVFALLPPAPEVAAKVGVAWAEPGVIESTMGAAGLEPVDSGEFADALAFPDVATATRAVLSASARAIAHAGAETVAEAISATLPRVTRADGTVVWNNRFRWVKARVA